MYSQSTEKLKDNPSIVLLKQGECFTPEQIMLRLEKRLREIIEEQSSCPANFFSSTISRVIRELEDIRGRPYITCTKCGVDLTLVICKHHTREEIVKDIEIHNSLRAKGNITQK